MLMLDFAEYLALRAIPEVILDLLPDPLCVLDAAGKIIYANAPAVKTLGAGARQELFGKSASDFRSLPHSDRFWIEQEVSGGCSAHGRDEGAMAAGNADANGDFQAVTVPLFNDDNAPAGLICIRRDNAAAQAKRLESELEELRSKNDLLNHILNALPDLIFAKDLTSRFLVANKATARVMGVDDPAELIGKTDMDFYPPEIAAQYLADEQKIFENCEPVIFEQPINRLDGTYGVMVALKLPIVEDGGKIKGYIGHGRDITERRAAEHALRKSEAELAQAQFLARLGSWSLVIGEKDMHCSAGLLAIAGVPGDVKTLSPRDMLRLVDPADRHKVIDQARRTLKVAYGTDNVEIRAKCDIGCKERRIYQARMSLEKTFGGSRQLCGFCLDITDQRRAEKKLEAMAYTDSLTGLLNRLGLRRAFTEARERNPNALYELLIIDLDGFKSVNDMFGHQAGDQVLTEAAERLKKCAGPKALIARLGGDEFAIVLSPARDRLDAEMVAAACVEIMRLPIHVGGWVAHIGTSVGITTQAGRNDTLSDLLSRADTALYRAKREGRNGYRRYEDSVRTVDTTRFEIASKMRHAVEDEALFRTFQPAGLESFGEQGEDDGGAVRAEQDSTRITSFHDGVGETADQTGPGGVYGLIGIHPAAAHNDGPSGRANLWKTSLASDDENGDIEDGRLAVDVSLANRVRSGRKQP
jgi:diguanylate cyclase (GGDEF)-like protein/PAS domain S-box-containing protein